MFFIILYDLEESEASLVKTKHWVANLLQLLTQLICGETQRPHPTTATRCL